MSESNLYKQLKSNWKNYIQRIEPKDLNCGIPDCHLVNSECSDIFIELKFLKKEFKNRKLPIKTSQFIWHSKYTGRNGFMLFRVSSCFYLFRSLQVHKLKGKIKFEDFRNDAWIACKNLKTIIDFLEKSN